MTIDDDWRAFTLSGAETLAEFKRNAINMTDAFRFFETGSALIGDDDAFESLLNTVSEIDGFPRHYAELMALLASLPTRDALIAWLKS